VTNDPPFISDQDDPTCLWCAGRGCEACYFRVLVMLDVADDE